MSNENESTPARRVDDTRPAGRIDWDDPTRTAGAAKGGNTILDGIPKYEWWLMDREDSCEYVKVADVEARLAAPTVHSTTAAEWVSVDERLPDDCEAVLINLIDPVGGLAMWEALWLAGSETFESSLHGWVAVDEVSHWLRIPPVPGQQVAQGEKGGDANG